MEGSVATQGGAAAGAEGASGAAGAEGGPDLATLAQTLDGQVAGQAELRQIVTDMASNLTAFTTAQAGEGDEGDGAEGEGEIDLSFLEDPTLDAASMAGHLQGLIKTQAEQVADAKYGPLAKQVDTIERRAELAALVDEVPEMKDPAIADQVVKTTATLADAYGWPEQLKTDPKMYRVVYLASKAMEIAGEEGDGGDPAVATLEGGGGARLSGAQQGKDLGEAIVGARKGRSALPFG